MNRILFVDDEPNALTALRRIFEPEGFLVVTAAGAAEGLHLMETSEPFQVVCADYRMPDMNGVQFLERVRTMDQRAARILLTAVTEPHVAVDAINRGEVHRYLTKPWDTPSLLAVVHQACVSYHLMRRNEELNRQVHARALELEKMNRVLERLVEERTVSLLEGLTCALDQRDTETQWHSRRVALYAHRIAEEMGISGTALLDVDRGALLHDIGKIGVRDTILLKPDKLTDEEWKEMKRHPVLGYQMLRNIEYLHHARIIVLHHHEHWDGSGYPQRLAGSRIVPGARIFALADTLDAISSDRPYRKACSFDAAKEEIFRCANSQFDPAVVGAYRRIAQEDFDRIRAAIAEREADDRRARSAEMDSIAAGILLQAD